jgi:hypothetical protein
MRCRKQGTSAQPLDQPHLYLRLLAQRGGEADLQGIVTLTLWPVVTVTITRARPSARSAGPRARTWRRPRPVDDRSQTYTARPIAITPGSNAIFNDQLGAYTIACSKHSSVAPSPRMARKRSSKCFVIWILHRVTKLLKTFREDRQLRIPYL